MVVLHKDPVEIAVISKVTDLEIMLECLYEVYGSEEYLLQAGKSFRSTMAYPFVKMIESQCHGLPAKDLHRILWNIYLKKQEKSAFIITAKMRLLDCGKEVDSQISNLYFTKQYKKALQKLTEDCNLETVLFLRLLMETGIRSRDVYQMDAACIEGKKVRVQSSKVKSEKTNIYRWPDGSLPRISGKTIQIAKALDRTQGKWFTKPYDYYIRRIRKVWNSKEFSVHMLRRYRLNREWNR